jgi:hypothetical protein
MPQENKPVLPKSKPVSRGISVGGGVLIGIGVIIVLIVLFYWYGGGGRVYPM